LRRYFFYFAALARQPEPRSDGEHFLLTNCENVNHTMSSQMAYYSGSRNAKPVIALVPSEPGQSQRWENASPCATFPDNDVFCSNIGPPVESGAYGGGGRSKQRGDFFCYFRSQGFAYEDYSGNRCVEVYACNHTAPGAIVPSVSSPSDTLRLHVTIDLGSYYSKLERHWEASEILKAFWDRREQNIMDQNPLPLGRCNIKFSGWGEKPWTTIDALGNTLINVVGTLKGLAIRKETSMTETCEWSELCKPTSGVLLYTLFPSSMRIVAINTLSQKVSGELRYDISCPSQPEKRCTEIYQLVSSLNAMPSVYTVMSIFRAAGAVSDVSVNNTGC
jgi:hypothetical protein